MRFPEGAVRCEQQVGLGERGKKVGFPTKKGWQRKKIVTKVIASVYFVPQLSKVQPATQTIFEGNGTSGKGEFLGVNKEAGRKRTVQFKGQ